MMLKALEGVDGGTRLDVKVVAGAPVAEFPAGYDEWRERVTAKVASRARDGAANTELLSTLETFFGLDAGGARILSGKRSRRKTVRLAIDAEAATELLKDGLEG